MAEPSREDSTAVPTAAANVVPLGEGGRVGAAMPPPSAAAPTQAVADADGGMGVEAPVRRRKGIYLLPNLFTAGCLFCGFYAIIAAINGKFADAGVAVFCAMLMDSLDGRVARLTGTQSEFGAQFDSLADMVSFGAAPALVVYQWSLSSLGKIGWIAAFVYCACAALRLARFNTNIGVVDKRWFQGMPSPAAAALLMGFVWLMTDLDVQGKLPAVAWTVLALAIYAGVTMVSYVPFYSFKDLSLKKSVPFLTLFGFVALIALVSFHPPSVLWGLFVVYALSGYAVYGYRVAKGKRAAIIATSTDDPEEQGLHDEPRGAKPGGD
jgi:CDP-diacylglycerol--serine O-phosphatidyltransferase